jgi:hypothetical protein
MGLNSLQQSELSTSKISEFPSPVEELMSLKVNVIKSFVNPFLARLDFQHPELTEFKAELTL